MSYYQRQNSLTPAGRIRKAINWLFVVCALGLVAIALYVLATSEVLTSAAVIHTLPPTLTATGTLEPTLTPTATPHLRLTQIAAEVAEVEGEAEKARLQAEARGIEAAANASYIRVVSDAQADADERRLQITQIAQALAETQQVFVGTQEAASATRTGVANADEFMRLTIAEKQKAIETQANMTALIIVFGVACVLAVLVGAIIGSDRAKTRKLEATQDNDPEWVDAETNLPMTEQEYYIIYRNLTNYPDESPTAIAGRSFAVSGNPSGAMVGKVKAIIDYLDTSPTDFSYRAFVYDWSSRSRNVVTANQ